MVFVAGLSLNAGTDAIDAERRAAAARHQALAAEIVGDLLLAHADPELPGQVGRRPVTPALALVELARAVQRVGGFGRRTHR